MFVLRHANVLSMETLIFNCLGFDITSNKPNWKQSSKNRFAKNQHANYSSLYFNSQRNTQAQLHLNQHWRPKNHQSNSPNPNLLRKNVASGLQNLGNTCFLNSVLQILSHSKELLEAMRKHSHRCVCPKTIGVDCVLCALELHINMVWQEQQVVAPWNIVKMLPSLSSHLTFGEQHDAHEFFLSLD